MSATAAILGTTLSSFVFYAWWNPPFVLLPVASIVANFCFARLIAAAGKPASKRLLILGIASNLFVLCYWKYADFLLSIIHSYKAAPPVVPLALSFTTFVQIAFLVDVYRRHIPFHFGRYAFFVAFFPHLIAGPIVRWNSFGRQLGDDARFRLDLNVPGLRLRFRPRQGADADALSHVSAAFDAAAKATRSPPSPRGRGLHPRPRSTSTFLAIPTWRSASGFCSISVCP